MGPRVEQAIHHHMVSVWPISASTGCLKSFPRGASHGKKTRAGAVRARRLSRFPRRGRPML
ncbi:hypothetical protein T02_12796 [Trichinella nativa]|uniref:Uncharacterized protein n=1 Tax=Trichinella nativa TaxID=6335 RepID=A0A0V1KUR0_9BILA|nr:hypothetical protein T02_12796 [Trichinella nativa]